MNRCDYFGGVAAYFIRSLLACVCVCVVHYSEWGSKNTLPDHGDVTDVIDVTYYNKLKCL
jgi:hypothetical protein